MRAPIFTVAAGSISILSIAILLFAAGAGRGLELAPELLTPTEVQPLDHVQFQEVLAHHRGNVVVVNLWATWCIPCVAELPELDLLQQRYRDRGLVVLAVSLDDAEGLESRVRPFFKEKAPALVSYLSTEDSYAFIEPLDAEWLGAIPTSFFLDRQGKVRKTAQGRLAYRSLEREVLELLEEGTEDPPQPPEAAPP